MIDLYTYPTPNGRKPAIMLEELGLPYTIKKVDLSQGEQFKADFVAINPNSKIPAMVDHKTGLTIFESGAILIYLAEQTGQLLPKAPSKPRYDVLQWLMFQMGNVGPMFGQLGHFRHSAPETVEYGINRYETETNRLLQVMEGHLAHTDYLAGDYSIADIATYPWVAIYGHLGVDIAPYPNVKRWLDQLAERPAVQNGMAILKAT
jgi:GST-like protein